jgi:hypothetical protein
MNDLSDNNRKKKCIKIVKRMDKIDKQIAEAKTMCCKAKWYRKSRANFRCEKCDKDVTIEVMFFIQAVSE